MRLSKGIFKFVLVVTVVYLASVSLAASDHRTTLFEQGTQSFQNGEFDKAVQSFSEILQMGYESADLYYNLGNSYFKLGENATAILNYERALRLRPRDEDIRFNLQIANISVLDKIQEIPELFYIRYFKGFRSLFDIRTLTILTLILYFLFFSLVILWIFTKPRILRRISKWTALVVFVILIVFSITLISKITYLRSNVEAIVMTPEVIIRSAPSEDGTEIFTIHSGLKVKITATSGNWSEIRLADGKEGWLLSKELEII
jgi:tetratricopeptide (TPR) repeat protein